MDSTSMHEPILEVLIQEENREEHNGENQADSKEADL